MTNLEVLEALERGDITAKKALSLLRGSADQQAAKRGRMMRIRVVDGERRFHIPIPLGLVYGGYVLSKAAVKVGSYFDKKDGKVKGISDILENVSDEEMRQLIHSLRTCDTDGFVEVHDGDDHVVITID